MSEKIINRWLRALESGSYSPSRYKLRTKEGYCPLGVLCDLVKADLGLDWFLGADGVYRFEGCDISVPKKVVNLIDNDFMTGFDLANVGGNGYTFIVYGQDIRDLHDYGGAYGFRSVMEVLRKLLS